MSTRTLVVDTPSEIEGLRRLWTEVHAGGETTIFQSFEWNRLAARVFTDREKPRICVVENQNGAAIIPASVTSTGVRLLGDELFDYRDVLAIGDEDEPLSAAWRELARAGAGLDVSALRGDEVRGRWEGMGFDASPFVSAPCVRQCDIDAERFVSLHNRSGRLLRRLAKEGAAVKRYPGSDSILVRRIYELKANQDVTDGTNLFTDEARREFLVAAAATTPSDVFTLETASTLVAALVTFRDGCTRRFYTTYYDRSWAHFSPGIAVLFEATRLSLAEGLDCDYMTGEQAHKLRFATSSVPLYRVHATAEDLAALRRSERLMVA